MTLHETATAYRAAGLCVLPAKRAEKRPAVGQWRQYRDRLPTEADVGAWFANAHDALCLVCGRVSGGLEMIDFDAAGALFPAWWDRLPADLRDCLVVEQSPSGGRHAVYRCEAPAGNLKLAQRQVNGKTVTLIETRGEGGLFLCAPTPGYVVTQGDLTNPPRVTTAERDAMLLTAWELTETPPPVVNGPAVARQGGERPGDDFNARGDLRALLVKHGWTLEREGENEHWCRPGKDQGTSATLKGGVFYVFSSSAAPFEPSRGYSAFAVYALLEHGGDYWAAARALGAAGFGRPPDGPEASVNLSGILSGLARDDDGDEPETPADPGEVPDHLLRIPGFVEQVMDRCMAGAPAPLLPTAFCGALALQSHLCARKVREPGDLRTNLYLLALTGSSAGKNYPRLLNKQVLHVIGGLGGLGDRFASAEGLEDDLCREGAKLYQNDEIDALLQAVKQSTDGRMDRIIDVLNELFTSAGTFYKMRSKAGQNEPEIIDQPHLTLFGTALPENCYGAMTERMLTNGFFARTIIIDADRRKAVQDALPVDDLPRSILDVALWWREFNPGAAGNLKRLHPTPVTVPYESDAKALLDLYRAEALRQENAAMDRRDEVARATWGRANENARKLALLYACSADCHTLRITETAAEWAVAFTDHQVRRMLHMAWRYVASGEFHARCLRFKNILRRAEGQTMRHSRMINRMHLKPRELAEVVQVLVESGAVRLVETTHTGAGRPGQQYRLVE